MNLYPRSSCRYKVAKKLTMAWTWIEFEKNDRVMQVQMDERDEKVKMGVVVLERMMMENERMMKICLNDENDGHMKDIHSHPYILMRRKLKS